MPATVLKLKPRTSTAGLRCSECGAATKATCNCGAIYISAGEYAAKAVAASPKKSNRAVADDLGVSRETVRRARKTAGTNVPPTRTGKDGKDYPAKRPRKKLTLQAKVNKMAAPPVKLSQGYISELEEWLATRPLLDEGAVVTLLNALHLCAENCQRLAQQIEVQYPKEKKP
jgi:hypothetical protein